MAAWTDFALPFGSVLVGGAVTYFSNVRQRRRGDVDDVFIEAAMAVNLADSAQAYMTEVNSPLLTSTEHEVLRKELTLDGVRNDTRREQEAREALARASVYEPSLSRYCIGDSIWIGRHGDEIRQALVSTRIGARALAGKRLRQR